MAVVESPNRIHFLKTLTLYLLVALAAKVLFSILYEYRLYFPANFHDSTFLAARKPAFHGAYRAAFYTHIVTGPIALVFAFMLMFTGLKRLFGERHKLLGKFQVFLVVVLVAPSGLIMAKETFSGPLAGWGFASLSIATGVSAAAAGYYASRKQFATHQVWATRCFILLCSPLALRLTSGFSYVIQIESELTYRLSAWLSWLLPLIVYECWRRRPGKVPTDRSHALSFSNERLSK